MSVRADAHTGPVWTVIWTLGEAQRMRKTGLRRQAGVLARLDRDGEDGRAEMEKKRHCRIGHHLADLPDRLPGVHCLTMIPKLAFCHEVARLTLCKQHCGPGWIAPLQGISDSRPAWQPKLGWPVPSSSLLLALLPFPQNPNPHTLRPFQRQEQGKERLEVQQGHNILVERFPPFF